jgi:superfamily II DNA or RNA helicase
MSERKGYIYVRIHESYEKYEACKVGKAENIPDRDSQYATGEIVRGEFKDVYEVKYEDMSKIEEKIQERFKEMKVYRNGGTEFYNKRIMEKIEEYLRESEYDYKKLNKEEIDNLTRKDRKKDEKKKDKITNKKVKEIIQRKDQEEIIKKAKEYYKENNKGILVLMCGVGKTLISLWITKDINSRRILIGVPNELLLKQWEEVVKIFFKKKKYITVNKDNKKESVEKFLEEYGEECIVITTYASSYKVKKAAEEKKYKFDMKIYDEMHHLTTINMKEDDTKEYIEILKIKSGKQLGLTATMKEIENNNNVGMNVVSNNDKEIFGEIIERKNLSWAIQKKVVCDYVIQTIITDEEKLEEHFERFNIDEENDKRMFLSAYTTLKSIIYSRTHHILIYTNNMENSSKIIKYINNLISKKYFEIDDICYSEYNSNMTTKEQKDTLERFKSSKYGIMTCVYCLGEGWDLPLLDGVVFSENMTSNIRIVQSALRACRKNKNEENKISKIILPVLNTEEWCEKTTNKDLQKVREVIYQMGLEDENINHKIKVYKIKVENKNKNKIKEEDDYDEEIGEYDEQLTKILKLKIIKRSELYISYEKAKMLIKEKNIKNKEEYYKISERDNRLSSNPEELYNGKFKNWIDYLSIDKKEYYDKDECKKMIDKYMKEYPELKKNHMNYEEITKELYKIDKKFPPNGLWVELYNIKNISELIQINKKKKGKRIY